MAKGNQPDKPNSDAIDEHQHSDMMDLDERKHRLEQALIQKGAFKQPEPEKTPPNTSYAIKLSSEFLAAIVVGVVLGLGFDQLIGTNPWGLIVFLFLGFAAGVMNVLRSVGMMDENSIGKQNKDKDN
ncbi:AtpZ/AtpI family protein [Bartonella sp. HY329]|uniref:AtpZ/AtpI family protein n=1 Tax=unclassified Bartonella TaxID=2645622 RepID=UPI0021C96F2D|nr:MULTISPECIES: AtpZ/AtpI family protein [unclassified Bartonella]UXM96251.1 AtpZ/AtpI family protein [Bartonella sp. HY329]UXN10575.1 AtpZ/AtpI family protein [Bartonella sp. HY328]